MNVHTGPLATPLPERLSRLEASNKLRTHILKWLRAVVAWIDNGREGAAPQIAVKGEAGLGKTALTLDEVAVILRDFPELRILYLVPSTELGEELEAKAREKGVLNPRLLRGRSQRQPGSPEKMCIKADIAETLAALSISVSDSLCRKKKEDGTVAECPHAATCPYLAQLQEAKRGGLIIASHQYLSVRMEPIKDIDAIIVDESFTQVLCADRRVDLGRFASFRTTGAGIRGRREQIEDANIELGQAVDSFRAVLDVAERESRQPTLAEFAGRGFTEELCRFLAGLEYSRIEALDIDPEMSEEQQRDILKEAQVQEAFAFARVWKILGAELASGRQGEPHGLVIERGVLNPKTRELANYIHAFWSRDPRFENTPALILDADADAVILRRFFPAAEFVEIAAKWQNVEIVQCYDRTGSAQSMKGERRRDEAYNAALDMADRLSDLIDAGESESGRLRRRPLLVAAKSVIESYREAGELESAPFDTAHFGNLRGKDGWNEAVGIVIAGRIQPSVPQIEGLARSIWYADPEPLSFIAADDAGRFILPTCQHWTAPKRGEARAIDVSYHPDDRANRVLRQVREAELMQAIARVRPVHRSAEIPCQIVVLSNVPLAVQPDRVAAWAEIVPDRFDMARLAGFIPEIAADMASAYPSLFASAGSVRAAACRRHARAFGEAGGALQNPYINQKGCVTGWLLATFERPLKVGNRAGRVWVRHMPGDTPAKVAVRIRAFLPDALDIQVSMPAPSGAAAEAAAPGRRSPDGFRYIAASAVILAQNSGTERPFWIETRQYRSRVYNKNSLTSRCASGNTTFMLRE